MQLDLDLKYLRFLSLSVDVCRIRLKHARKKRASLLDIVEIHNIELELKQANDELYSYADALWNHDKPLEL